MLLVRKSIERGYLLHVLSRKTLYFKEGKSTGKMTNAPQESYREIRANGEVYIEKNTECYRGEHANVPSQSISITLNRSKDFHESEAFASVSSQLFRIFMHFSMFRN